MSDEQREKRACEQVARLAGELAKAVKPIWHWGDGEGGDVQRRLDAAFVKAGLKIPDERRELLGL